MPSTTKPDAPTIDGKSIVKALTKGFQTKATKRGGKAGFTLIQKDGRTLAMASIRAKDGAVKLEGNRIGKTLRVETGGEVTAARKKLEAIAKANADKVKKAKAKTSPAKVETAKSEPTAEHAKDPAMEATKARVAAVEASGRRARSRTQRAEVVA